MEGTWPYVRGGVSSWVNQLILGLPELTFSVFFIGGQRENYEKRHYAIPPTWCTSRNTFSPGPGCPGRRPSVQDARRRCSCCATCSAFLHHPDEPSAAQGDALVDAFAQGSVTLDDFMYSRASWEAITEGYERYCTDPSFVDYLWTLRAMQAPLLMLAERPRAACRVRG